MKHISRFNEMFDTDSILDKINKYGIDSLDIYDKISLKNSDIQKRLTYEYDISTNHIKGLLKDFNMVHDIKNLYIDKTYYLDNELKIGDYDESKFSDIVKLGIYLKIKVFEKGFERTSTSIITPGKITYNRAKFNTLDVCVIGMQFFKNNSLLLVLYDNINDEVFELDFRYLKNSEFILRSENEVKKLINIVNNNISNNDVILCMLDNIYNEYDNLYK